MLWELLMELYRFLGSLTCHQIPARSIEAGGAYIHVCARDTGIYLGALTSILFVHITGRTGADRPPSLKYGLIFCIMFIPMLWDGSTSYLGLRTTNNGIRLLTGILFGIPIPFLLVTLLNFKVAGNNTIEIINGGKEIAIVVSAAIGLGYMVLDMEELFGTFSFQAVLIISFLVIFSQIYIYFTLCRAITALFWKGSQAGGMMLSVFLLLACFSILYLISQFILKQFSILYGI